MIPEIPKIQDPDKYEDLELPREKLEYALREALKKIDYGIECFGDKFPESASRGNVYGVMDNVSGWGTGFWTGILWHAYELTGDEKYKNVALSHIPGWTKRITEKIGVNHHDMGFLYSPSCVAAWKLCESEEAKDAAITAADHLCGRFQEKGEFLQAWGKVDDPLSYRLIIDCLLNIPLLYWASSVTGDKSYEEKAYKHFSTTVDVIYRPDASTYHTYYFDPETGVPLRGATAQGAFDGSAWGRGQSWGIYGPLLTYIYKKDEKALRAFKSATNYFLNNTPSDYVAYWDLSFDDGADEPKDSSCSAIAVCGMLEGIKHMEEGDPLKRIYLNASKRIINSLIDSYITKDVPEANGLLLHQVYSKPHKNGVDEMNIWGDYFYMEALHRMLIPEWKLYW